MQFKHRAVSSDIGDIKVESEKSRVAAFLPRCIFNLAMNEVLHRLSKYDCRWRYAMQPFAVGEKTYQARIRRTALSIYLQQPRILYNSTMEIGKVHRERKYQRQRQSITLGGSEPIKTGSINNNRTNATKRQQPYEKDIFRCSRRWRGQKESQPFG